MQASKQRRTEAAIRQSQLLCDAAVYPVENPGHPTTALKTLTGEKSAAVCYSTRVGIAREEETRKPCSRSVL